MKIEVRELMDDNEMLSHIFIGCIDREDLIKIKDEYIGDKNWQEESVKLPVEMKIGGISVNPKEFFEQWKIQMNDMIIDKAQDIIKEQTSSKLKEIVSKIQEYQEVIDAWSEDINWNVKNPLK